MKVPRLRKGVVRQHGRLGGLGGLPGVYRLRVHAVKRIPPVGVVEF